MKSIGTIGSNPELKIFFFSTFLFSWLVWGSILAFDPADGYLLPLIFLGAFGPSITAVFLMWRNGSSKENIDFWKRVVNFKQIGWKWYGVIFLIFPAILVVGYFFHALFGGEIPSYEMYFGGIGSAGDLLFFIFLMLLGGPLAEELGWRGYCLDPLQKKFGAVMASLIIGVIWIAWHLPLFFVEGTSQYAKGFGVAFWSWSLQIVAISLIFTWVYNNNGRSILSAILLHLMANIAYPLNLDAQGEFIFSLVRVAVAVLLVLVFLKKPAHEQLVEAKKVVV